MTEGAWTLECSKSGDVLRDVVWVDDVSDETWPSGLTLDHGAERIYWIDVFAMNSTKMFTVCRKLRK
jgi:hypothetical protein